MQELTTTESLPYVLIREAAFPGSWGRGETVEEASRNLRQHVANPGPVYVALVSRDGHVDGMGDLLAVSRGPIYRATMTRGGKLARLVEYRPARAD